MPKKTNRNKIAHCAQLPGTEEKPQIYEQDEFEGAHQRYDLNVLLRFTNWKIFRNAIHNA